MAGAPILLWLRRDLRLTEAPALHAAAQSGRPVIPLYLRDGPVLALGAASKWRLEAALAAFVPRLEGLGARLVLRTGEAREVLPRLVAETGATAIFWSRLYDRPAVERDGGVKAWAKAQGIEARSFPGFLLHEPWEVQTGAGGPYRVYTPYWRAVKDRPVPPPQPAVRRLAGPDTWPASEVLADWRLGATMDRGAAVLARHARAGEAEALDRLSRFLRDKVGTYADRRDVPADPATSGLSPFLTWGEISPRTIWHGAMRALHEGARGAETFLKELVWREFAWHLFYHHPDMGRQNWRADWDRFPWRGDGPEAERWRQGRTGVPLVDAAMRQMYVTGTMHNRARMVVASYLTKHLLTDWRVGCRWFADCLVDWDPASNAMGWQWVAGSGPDAAPFFRVFNPEGQAEKFDPDGAYRGRWLAEGQADPPRTALDFFDAAPRSWGLSPDDPAPEPLVDLKAGRKRALAAYARL